MVPKCLDGRAPDYLSQKSSRRQAHRDKNQQAVQKRPESTEMQIKNWAAIFLLVGKNFPQA